MQRLYEKQKQQPPCVRNAPPVTGNVMWARQLMRRIEGVIKSSDSKYIMLNAPKSQIEAITELLPGSDSPTVIPLAGTDDLVAIQAVCTETVFWETLEDLKALGARAILVLPIEKMMS